jgi:hypothetical protein
MAGVGTGDQDSGLGLAELVAAFSLATDLGMGQPMEHGLRSWLIAVRLGERLGLGAEARAALFYVMVLAWVGCVADTSEVAAWFGDDIAFRGDSYRVDLAGLPLMGFAVNHAGAGTPLLHRLRLAASLVLTGGRAVERGLMMHCLTTTQLAGRFGLTAEVCDPLRQVFTRWDGKGVPDGVGGEQIAWPVRLFHLADTVEVFHRAGGVDAAVEVARSRRGRHFDPEVVDLFCRCRGRRARRGRAAPGPAARRARRAHAPRDRGPVPHRPRRVDPAGRPRPGHHRQDRGHPYRAHLRQDRGLDPLDGHAVRHAARPAGQPQPRRFVGRTPDDASRRRP